MGKEQLQDQQQQKSSSIYKPENDSKSENIMDDDANAKEVDLQDEIVYHDQVHIILFVYIFAALFVDILLLFE